MKDLRGKDLARIHCLKKDLALSDENYRALLKGLTGQDSAKVWIRNSDIGSYVRWEGWQGERGKQRPL